MEGPTLAISKEIDKRKYRQDGEDFKGKIVRIANALKDNDEHFNAIRDIAGNMRFLFAGRIQNAVGAPRQTAAHNCFVSGEVEDSMASIMTRAAEAAETMRRGGGLGFDFSKLRPRGDRIVSLGSQSSGPVSFMQIYDAVCQTIASSGHRRGAMMGVLRIDHPDIEAFITAKQNDDKLKGFNISVGVTDEFMHCLAKDKPFNLTFNGNIYNTVSPVALWDMVMRSTWDWAEPGVLFLDTINNMNNLYYCEQIAATNPCGEQPLPPYGACLLGSFNLVKYVNEGFDYAQLREDIPHIVRAMDNVIDRTIYPLPEQKKEAILKRRMGIGVTGMANAATMLEMEYGSGDFLLFERRVLRTIRDETYSVSADLAQEKGAFPLYDAALYSMGRFIKQLPLRLQDKIKEKGMRNSHLTSIAPTGTISLTADNISSGIEPPFALRYNRTIAEFDGGVTETVADYAAERGWEGEVADEISAEAHVNVLAMAAQYIDSGVSKTCNVGANVSYDDFKSLYTQAWKKGAKGITTFRAAGKRYGVLNKIEEGAEACFIDPDTGQKECE